MTSPARIRSPVSSQVSRTAACSGLSPDSILPAGNVHGGFPRGPRIRKLCSRQCSIYEYRFRRVSRAYTHSHDPVQSYSSAADTVFRIPKALAPPHGVRRPDGETDRRLRRRGRAAETRSGRSGCRRCPRSAARSGPGGPGTASRMAGTPAACPKTPGSPGPREGHRSGIIQRAGPPADGQAPGTSRRNRRCGSQAAGAQEGTAARNVRAPVPAITLSDSQGQEERAQCRLICTGTVPSIRSAGGAQNDTFCRVCSPLQMCGGDVGTLVLFGQTSDSLRKEAAVLGPVAPEPTTTHPPAACPA